MNRLTRQRRLNKVPRIASTAELNDINSTIVSKVKLVHKSVRRGVYNLKK